MPASCPLRSATRRKWPEPVPVQLPNSLSWATPTDSILLRICSTAFAASEPSFRATGASRFDDPQKIFTTLYCAADFETCYSETLLRDGTFHAANGRFEVSQAIHDSRSLTVIAVDLLKLRLVDLHGVGIRKMGLDAGVGLGQYAGTQPLARALYEHVDKPDGIVFASRLSPGRPAIVFFDRAQPHVRLFPGLAPTPLPQLREAFDALTQLHNIALL